MAIEELLDLDGIGNVYYTLDTASILIAREYEFTLQMDPENAQEFVRLVDQAGMENLVRFSFDEYSHLIISHPDRVLWGTDVFHPWHFEAEAMDVLVDFSRQFIALLPVEIQENYAFRNAQRAFGHYLDD